MVLANHRKRDQNLNLQICHQSIAAQPLTFEMAAIRRGDRTVKLPVETVPRASIKVLSLYVPAKKALGPNIEPAASALPLSDSLSTTGPLNLQWSRQLKASSFY